MIDWAIVISAIAVIISLITLYVAHLRGPNIQMADPGDLYPPSSFHYGSETSMGFMKLKLLFANSGNRSGILFNIDIPKPNFVTVIQFDPKLEVDLPVVIPPSQGKSFEVTLFLQKPSQEIAWKEILKDKESLELNVKFKKSTSFPWNKTEQKMFQVDIQEMKNLAERVY